MSLPVFRAAGAKSVGTTAAVTVAAPAGIVIGDLEILITESSGSNDRVSITNNGGGAWTQLPGCPVTTSSVSTELNGWWRIRASGDSDPQVIATTDHVCAVRLAYQVGTFDTSNPFEIEATGIETTTDTSLSFAPGTTTGGNDRLVLCISTSTLGTNTAQVPVCANGNLTNRLSRANYQTSSGNGGGFGVTEGARVLAGAVGTFTCTYANGSNKAYLSIAIKPFAALGPAGLKTVLGTPKASVKTIRGLPIGQVKTWIGLP